MILTPNWNLLFASALVIFAINYLLQLAELLGFIQIWYTKNLVKKYIISDGCNNVWTFRAKFFNELSKPLFGCPVCMSSIWGTVMYLIFEPNKSIASWVVAVIMLAGLIRLLKSFT